MAIRFEDADNVVLGKRYYLDHSYKLLRKRQDSSYREKTSLALGHIFTYETKYYQYLQERGNAYYGDFLLTDINDKASLKTFHNQLNVAFYNKALGALKGTVDLFNYNYFFNSRFISDAVGDIGSQMKGNEIALGGEYAKTLGRFSIEGLLKYTLVGDLTGDILNTKVAYDLGSGNRLSAALHSSSRLPDFNFLRYQSEYINYNWDNLDTFEKQRNTSLTLGVASEKWGVLEVDYSLLNNYSYFGVNPDVVVDEGLELANIKPLQETSAITYLKAKYQKEVRWRKFALNNTVMYQNVGQENQVLNVPQLVTRNTLYFSSDVFDKAMFLQTGITFKYFTSYAMNAYNPVLAEFVVQNREELGGYPLLDFFINAKIKQTRIFLKAEHFNSSFTGYDFYAAPNYPYRDFVIRFGLVWNFFS